MCANIISSFFILEARTLCERGHTERLKSSGFSTFTQYTCAQSALSHPEPLQTLKEHTNISESKPVKSKTKQLPFSDQVQLSCGGGIWLSEWNNHFVGRWLRPKCALLVNPYKSNQRQNSCLSQIKFNLVVTWFNHFGRRWLRPKWAPGGKLPPASQSISVAIVDQYKP